MPSRREVIRMTPAEIQAFLAAHRRIIVVTNGPDGLPHPVPMNYGVDEEGRIIITTFRKSQKVKNLERDPRAALLIESGASYGELQSVIAYAAAEIIAEPAAVRENLRLIRADEALSGSLSANMSDQVQASMPKRVVVRFTPFRHVSWDHRKLGQFY